jgi:hypothetical protein
MAAGKSFTYNPQDTEPIQPSITEELAVWNEEPVVGIGIDFLLVGDGFVQLSNTNFSQLGFVFQFISWSMKKPYIEVDLPDKLICTKNRSRTGMLWNKKYGIGNFGKIHEILEAQTQFYEDSFDIVIEEKHRHIMELTNFGCIIIGGKATIEGKQHDVPGLYELVYDDIVLASDSFYTLLNAFATFDIASAAGLIFQTDEPGEAVFFRHRDVFVSKDFRGMEAKEISKKIYQMLLKKAIFLIERNRKLGRD